MANKKNNQAENHTVDMLDDSLVKLTDNMKKNQKRILIICVVIALLIAGVMIYTFSARKSNNQAHVAIGNADRELLFENNDSAALEIYSQVAVKSGDAANRAKLEAAIILYNKGNYQEALDMVKGYKAKEAIIGAAAYSLKGDCMVQLDDFNGAVDAFKAAIKQSDNNPYYTPFFMVKLARVYGALNNYAEQANVYQEIVDKYPNYDANVNKELELAKIRAGK
ncbi:MAG: tetratricopeptide repeat protein [Muribaculaceae bacterium]|nr:tetratricopeptide repeat protein [Muribaculaceae bacterium]MDE5967775.1 tetratricopeptide repeat protein [Muribaculaceae bacterium]MDE7392984.1 tetratricopeptide repeat protein [Muribaculaceae bacterium]